MSRVKKDTQLPTGMYFKPQGQGSRRRRFILVIVDIDRNPTTRRRVIHSK